MSPTGPSRGTVAAVALCVFCSGTASLSLEVVWSRLLKLVFGSTTLAITTILVAYMLGLGLGGLLGARLAGDRTRAARPRRNGVRMYGLMEIGVGLYALGVPALLDLFPLLNRAVLGQIGFWPAAVVRFALVLALLAIPTLLMGATLPVLVAALVRGRTHLANRVGLLYGINTLGAVAGVLAVTFVAFRALGVRNTNLVAALVDIAVGVLAATWLARRFDASPASTEPTPESPPPDTAEPAPRARRWNRWLVTYALVGFTALAYEVAWTRALAMILGSSTYAFATMLAGFLAGIALGSLAARPWLDRMPRPAATYAIGLTCLGLSSLGIMFAFRALPMVFLRMFDEVGISAQHLVWLGFATSFALMLVPTVVLGALFPLVVRLVSADRSDAAAVGDVYFMNTVGSAAGAFTAGFVAIPLVGLRTTMATAIAINFACAAFVWWGGRRRAGPGAVVRRGVALATGAAAVLVLARPPAWNAADFSLGVYYRSSARLEFGLPKIPMLGEAGDELLFYEEGINCTVTVHRPAGGIAEGGISLRINGKTDASLADMSTQVLSGHLPFVFGGEAKTALVIGYASGVTTGAACLHDLDRVDVCEIEPAIMTASKWFDDYNHRPLERDDVRVILDDGRTYLAATRERYDVIISEPSNPWIAGCANLFTEEFFRTAHDALRPGGRLLQWIQIYEMDEAGLQSVLAALHRSFKYAYGFVYDAEHLDLMLVATDEPIDLLQAPAWSALPDAVRHDLARVRVFSTADIRSLLFLAPHDLRQLADGAPVVNTDDTMFVELSAPWRLYDESRTLRDGLFARASGVLPLVEGVEGRLAEGLLAEIGVAYLESRSNPSLAGRVEARLEALGDRAGRAVLQAKKMLSKGGVSGQKVFELLDGAVTSAPDRFLPRYERASFHVLVGFHDRALPDLETVLADRPDHLLARLQRATCLAALGRSAEALAVVEALIRSPLIETEHRLWGDGAILAARAGRTEDATAYMERYLALEPYAPEEWTMLAAWYRRLGRVDAAERADENAKRAKRNIVRRYHWAARWHERFGKRADAIRALEEALKHDPDAEAAREDLERLRRQRETGGTTVPGVAAPK